jgi:MOSC domain-containing protein YiiM
VLNIASLAGREIRLRPYFYPMTGSVLQISVSTGGVPKHAVPEAPVTALGVEGDGHAHPELHGGPDRAVLLITAEGIAELAALGFPLTYGSLGENLTTRGIARRDWRVGQRWRIGADVVIEITKHRAPCQQLNVYGPGLQAAIYDVLTRDGDPASPKWGLSGVYASVVTPGLLHPGDAIVLAP